MEFAPNRLSRIIAKTRGLPLWLQQRVLSQLVCRTIKYAGTSGLKVLALSPQRVHMRLENRTKVQNHIGSLHAAAMALLAESATGFVVGMSVPDDRVPVIKTLKVDYKKRAVGAMEAVATLSAEQIERIHQEPKGDITVPVVVTDAEGKSPIVCEMIWAWTPKRR